MTTDCNLECRLALTRVAAGGREAGGDLLQQQQQQLPVANSNIIISLWLYQVSSKQL